MGQELTQSMRVHHLYQKHRSRHNRGHTTLSLLILTTKIDQCYTLDSNVIVLVEVEQGLVPESGVGICYWICIIVTQCIQFLMCTVLQFLKSRRLGMVKHTYNSRTPEGGD